MLRKIVTALRLVNIKYLFRCPKVETKTKTMSGLSEELLGSNIRIYDVFTLYNNRFQLITRLIHTRNFRTN